MDPAAPMTECPRCKSALEELAKSCSGCGLVLDESLQAPATALELIRRYFSSIWQILTQPSVFFANGSSYARDGGEGNLSRPLCFALVTHWLGSSMGFLWQLSFGRSIGQWFRQLLDRGTDFGDPWNRINPIAGLSERVFQWFTGAGPVIVDPFLTLVSILFSSALLWIGARIFVTPRRTWDALDSRSSSSPEITYASAVRISCYSMSAAILLAVPIVGSWIAPLTLWIITLIGVREVYRISTARALAIALFPKLLLPTLIGLALISIAASILRFLF